LTARALKALAWLPDNFERLSEMRNVTPSVTLTNFVKNPKKKLLNSSKLSHRFYVQIAHSTRVEWFSKND